MVRSRSPIHISDEGKGWANERLDGIQSEHTYKFNVKVMMRRHQDY